MNDEEEKQKIRELIATWMQATADGRIDTVLELMADDVVFLLCGQQPIRGRDAFATAARAGAGRARIEPHADIQEIHINGDYAFCWNRLSVTITPLHGGVSMQRSGNILSVFRKEKDGRWLLWRDANMLS